MGTSWGDISQFGGARSDGTLAITDSAPTILTAAPGQALVVPHDAFLLKADFARAGIPLVFVLWVTFSLFAPWYYGL